MSSCACRTISLVFGRCSQIFLYITHRQICRQQVQFLNNQLESTRTHSNIQRQKNLKKISKLKLIWSRITLEIKYHHLPVICCVTNHCHIWHSNSDKIHLWHETCSCDCHKGSCTDIVCSWFMTIVCCLQKTCSDLDWTLK